MFKTLSWQNKAIYFEIATENTMSLSVVSLPRSFIKKVRPQNETFWHLLIADLNDDEEVQVTGCTKLPSLITTPLTAPCSSQINASGGVESDNR